MINLPSGTPCNPAVTSTFTSGSSHPPPQLYQPNSLTSRKQPRSVDDLPSCREPLHRSLNPAVRILAKCVEDIHNQLSAEEISPKEHLNRCYEILEAAELLCDVDRDASDADQAAEVLQKVGLSGMGEKGYQLEENEYLAISDDLYVQLDPNRGVVAHSQLVQRGRLDARRLLGYNNYAVTNYAETDPGNPERYLSRPESESPRPEPSHLWPLDAYPNLRAARDASRAGATDEEIVRILGRSRPPEAAQRTSTQTSASCGCALL